MKSRRKKPSTVFLTVLLGAALTAAVQPGAVAAAPPAGMAPAVQRVPVRTQSELDAALKNTARVREIQLVGAGPFALELGSEHSAPVGSLLNIEAAPGIEPVLSRCELKGVSRVRIRGMRLDGVRMNVVGGREVTVSNNVFRGSKGAVVAERVSNLWVQGNRIGTPAEGPSGNGIRLTGCVGGWVLGNVVRHAVSSGSGECITLSNCESVEIAFNLVSDRETIALDFGGEGIDVKGSRFVEVHDNVVRGNPRRPGIYIDSYDGTNHRVRVYNNVVHSCLSGIVVSGEFLNLSDRIEVRSNLVLGVKGQQLALADYSKRKSGLLPCREVQFVDNTAIRTLRDTRGWNLPVSIDARMEASGPGFLRNQGLVVENNRGYDLPVGAGGVWGRCVGLLEPRLSEGDVAARKLKALGTQRAELISDADKARNQKALESSVWVRERNLPGRNVLRPLQAVSRIRMTELDAALDLGLQGGGTPYENARTYLAGLGLEVSVPAMTVVPALAPRIVGRHELSAQSGPLRVSNDPASPTLVEFPVPASVRADFSAGNRVWKAVLNLPKLSVKAVNRRECWYEVRGRKADGSWTASSFGWMPKNGWEDGQQCANLGPVFAEALSGADEGPLVLQFRAVSAPGLEPMEPVQVGAGAWKLTVQTVEADGSYSAWPGVGAFDASKVPLALDWLEKAQLQYGAALDSASVVSRATPVQGRWEFERVENAGKPVLKCRFIPADARYQTVIRDLPLAIVPRPVTVKAPGLRMVYGDPVPAAGCEMEGVLEADRATFSAGYGWEIVRDKAVYGAQGRLAAGAYPLRVVARAHAGRPIASNYAVTLREGTLVVSRAAAQFSVRDAGRFAGDPNPGFEGVWTGFRAGENAAQLQVVPRIWTEATESSSVGMYAIRVEGPQTAGNYQVSYRPGRLQVFAPAAPGFYVGLSERGEGNGSLGQRVVLRVMASGAYSLQMRMGTRLSASNSGRLSAANSGNSVLESELGRLGGDFNGLPGVIRLELAKDGYFSGEVVAQGQSPVPVRGWLCTQSCGTGRFQVKDSSGASYAWELEAGNAGGGTLRGALPWGMGFRQLSQGAGPGGEVLVYSPMAGGGTLTGIIQATGAGLWSGSASLWVPGAGGWQKAALQAR